MVWLNQLFDGKFPIGISLGIIATVIAASVVLSLLFPRKEEDASSARPATATPGDEKQRSVISNQTAKKEDWPTPRSRQPSRSSVRFLWKTLGFYLLLLGLGLILAAALSD